jgi:hypothetical protein
MGASLGNPVQPPTVFELEEALGERAHQRLPIARDRSPGNSLANRIMLPLREMEKR